MTTCTYMNIVVAKQQVKYCDNDFATFTTLISFYYKLCFFHRLLTSLSIQLTQDRTPIQSHESNSSNAHDMVDCTLRNKPII